MVTSRMGEAYFEEQYATDPDPWGFDSKWYEKRKFALTIAALPNPRYERAFEPGCANGALTLRLLERCDEIVASDILPAVVERARQRVLNAGTSPSAKIDVQQLAIPDEWPLGNFDLVVLSEVLYYLTPDGFETAMEKLAASLRANGNVIAVHWRGETNYPLRGDDVHDQLSRQTFLRTLSSYEEESFRLSVFERG